MGGLILISEVVKETSCEANCNLQPDECIVWAATKYERSTMCLVLSVGISPGLAYAGNILLQLLQCTSGQGAGPQVSSAMFIHVFSERLCIREMPGIAGEAWLTCLRNGGKGLNLPIYGVFQLYLRSWRLANDWLVWQRWGSSPCTISSWLLKLMTKRVSSGLSIYVCG